jgi:hypothetical protein
MLHVIALALTLGAAAGPSVRADSVRADEDVRLAILRHADEVRHCYASEGLRRNPSLRGLVEIELTILPTGTVDDARSAESDLVGPGTQEVLACITTTARNWRFDRGPYAVESITFPFLLRPDERRPPTAAAID